MILRVPELQTDCSPARWNETHLRQPLWKEWGGEKAAGSGGREWRRRWRWRCWLRIEFCDGLLASLPSSHFLCFTRRKKEALPQLAFFYLGAFGLPVFLHAVPHMSFFQRVVHHLVNEVLVSGLANRCGKGEVSDVCSPSSSTSFVDTRDHFLPLLSALAPFIFFQISIAEALDNNGYHLSKKRERERGRCLAAMRTKKETKTQR